MYWLKADDDIVKNRIGIEYTKELKRYLLNEMPHRFYRHGSRIYETYPDKSETGFSMGDDLFGWYLTTIDDDGMLFNMSKKYMENSFTLVSMRKVI